MRLIQEIEIALGPSMLEGGGGGGGGKQPSYGGGNEYARPVSKPDAGADSGVGAGTGMDMNMNKLKELGEEMFKERFGNLNLPTMNDASDLQGIEEGVEMTEVAGGGGRGGTAGAATAEGGEGGIPAQLLAMMPPEIREIALRRPDLVQKAQVGGGQPGPGARAGGEPAKPIGMSTVKQAMMKKREYAERFAGAQAALEIAEGGEGELKPAALNASYEQKGGSPSSSDEGRENVNLLGL